ncbi:MAG: DUF1028 domain-containing protein [candidate division Zixibacteria bacterium]|nr:DUF1028 domain-containing protein [candidate division Zixibacteria bacterium]
MKTFATIVLFTGLLCVGSAGATGLLPLHPVNTYSIVCYDSVTGEFGAAVQSHWFKVADVIWAEPGVGVVATQSLVDFAYGPLGIEMMKNGRTAAQALAGLIESDPNSGVRQVAMIDADGSVVAHTGDKCIAEAGHRTGANYSVQANLMEYNTVWDAMAEAFEATDGDLADRMMAALEAAQGEGGDIRGKQSAAMIVVRGQPTGQIWREKLIDIRVDDSAEPLVELRRLLNITRAYDLMNEGDELLAEEDFDGASSAYEAASELAPGNLEILFWHAVTLAGVDEVERSLPIFREVFAKDENWRTLVPRLVASELLPNDSAMIQKIVGQ